MVMVLALLGLCATAPLSAQQVRVARPGKALGPTEVTIGFFLVELLEIDDVDESFTVDFVLQATWKDDRLEWEEAEDEEASSLIYDLEEVWHPRFLLVNDRELKRKLPEQLEVARDGTVTYAQRFHGRLSTDFQLRSFPSDHQSLAVELVTGRYSPDEVRLVVDTEWVGMLDGASVSGWAMEMGEPVVDSISVTRGSRLSRVTFQIEVQRLLSYFLWTMMLPLSLIVFMAYTVFWIDPNFLPSQVGVSTAAVFSMIAYRTALRLALPKVSYMTKADVFILGATVLVFTALGHAVATGRLAKTGREDLARLMKKWARWIYPLLFVLIVLLSIWW